MKEMIASIQKNAVGLGLFAIVTAGAIALAQVSTADRIETNQRLAQARALTEILPKGSYDNDLLQDWIGIDHRFNQQLLGPTSENAQIHVAKLEGEPIAFILPAVAPDGYTTHIKLLVGIRIDGSLTGVRVTSHKETPGLGDKVDLKKSEWILSFNGKSLGNPVEEAWKVKKDGGDFDQFTGATITPRAVVQAVKQALTFYRLHQNLLLSSADTGIPAGEVSPLTTDAE